jgi:hypothetical protein
MTTIAQKLASLRDRLVGAQKALSDLAAEDGRLRQAHAAALEERTRIEGSPLPLDEALARLNSALDAHVEHWRQARAGRFARVCGSPRDLEGRSVFLDGLPPHPSTADLVAIFPQTARAELTALVRQAYAADVTPGPPSTDRPRLLAAVNARITELEEEHTALVDFGRSQTPPIEIEYLPPVAERRRDEQRRRERAERGEAPLRAREAAVDAFYEARHGVGRSVSLRSEARRHVGLEE